MMWHITKDCTKAEWHLTYRCNLGCTNCNRMSWLPPPIPDMTMDDVTRFIYQAEELSWHPDILLIGGEPTLHPHCRDFAKLANLLSPGRVFIWSNRASPESRALTDRMEEEGLAVWERSAVKEKPKVLYLFDCFVAPVDFGETRSPCSQHAVRGRCGISVDSGGYTLCPNGGAIDATLGLGARTQRLSDLFDPEFAEWQTNLLCTHCGAEMGVNAPKIGACQIVHGSLMSPTWVNAVRHIQGNQYKLQVSLSAESDRSENDKPCL